jgi:hypothetical protein
MTREERLALDRRRRGRNLAMLISLLGLVVLFYFLSIARMSSGG